MQTYAKMFVWNLYFPLNSPSLDFPSPKFFLWYLSKNAQPPTLALISRQSWAKFWSRMRIHQIGGCRTLIRGHSGLITGSIVHIGTEGRIIEARVSHRKSSQQHTQAGPKKYSKMHMNWKTRRRLRRRPTGGGASRRPLWVLFFNSLATFCVFFGPSLCMLLATFPVWHSCFNNSALCMVYQSYIS